MCLLSFTDSSDNNQSNCYNLILQRDQLYTKYNNLIVERDQLLSEVKQFKSERAGEIQTF